MEMKGPVNVVLQASDGGQIHFDGVFYDYRDAESTKGIKLWTPPERPIRGILFHGNPGGGTGGDTRPITRDANLQVFAARHGFGIIGVTAFPGRDIYQKTGPTIFAALDDWAAMGVHPELANVPLIARGSSNAGITAYSLLCVAPERMICIAPNVGPRYNPATPPEAAAKVPALLHIGPEDPLLEGGVELTSELFSRIAPYRPLWAWDAEQGKGHAIGHIDDVDMKFFEQCIALRLPEDADPAAGPVSLRRLEREDGWLVDLESWQSGITTIAPYDEYEGDKTKAGWVPTDDIAYLYRSIATYDNPLNLNARSVRAVENPNERGTFLSSVGGSVVMAGSPVVLECDADGFPDWQRIEFYHGAELLKTARRGEELTCEVLVEPEHTVYAFTVIGYDSEGRMRTSYPTHFLVNTPETAEALAKHNTGVLDLPGPAPRPAPGASVDSGQRAPAPDSDDSVLVAYGLSAEQEKQAVEDDGIAPFWASFGEAQDAARMTPARHAVSDTQEPIEGLLVTIRAAYSRAGLYLLYEVSDDHWAERGGLKDAVDMHIGRHASDELWSADSLLDAFIKPVDHSLMLRGIQYQAHFGPAGSPADDVAMNVPSPWDLRRVELATAEAQQRYGIAVRRGQKAENVRLMQWYLPWSAVGLRGEWSQPPAGKRLATVLGYNDSDEDSRTDLRWPLGVDPWRHPARDGADPNPFGDIEMGPPLAD